MLLNSISRKVLVGYAAIIVIVAIVTSVLFTGLSDINRVTDEFVDKSLPALQNVTKVNQGVNRILVAAYSLYGYTIEKDAFETSVNSEFKSVVSAMKSLNILVPTGKKVNFELLKSELERFQSIMTSDEVDWDGARGSLTKIQEEATRIESIVSMSATVLSKEANQKTSVISNDVSSMRLWLFLSTLSIVVITAIAYGFAKKNIASPIKSLSKQLDNVVAHNDLSQSVDVRSNDEVALTAASINKLLSVFRKVNSDISNSAAIVKDSISVLNQSASLSGNEVAKLSDVVDKIFYSSEQLAASIADAANRSETASDIAHTGATQVEDGTANISQTANIISELSSDIDASAEMLLSLKQAGDKVSDVVKTIADIADQTNLLALNAAIEAARAGETGRGFAVVAGEVRTLASRTHESTYEINSILEEIVNSISSAVEAMDVNKEKANEAVSAAEITVDSLKVIQATVRSLSDENRVLATAAQGSQDDIGRMKLDLDDIKKGMTIVSDSSSDTKQTAATLAKLSLDLEQVAGQFKV